MKRVRMRWTGGLVLSAVVAMAIAAAVNASAVTILAGNLVIHLEGAASPKALPKAKMAPISFHVNASIATRDGSHIPPILSSHLQVDRHIRIDTTGLPSCTPTKLEATTPAQAMKACGPALIGKGSSTAQVEFPESAPFLATGPLLAFNGPSSGGGYGGGGYPEQIYYVYAHVPLPTTFVVVGKLSGDSGRYGYHVSIALPPIAGGSGSVKDVSLTINRRWTYKGQEHSYLNAECADGRFYAQVELDFADGTNLTGNVVKACQAKD